MDISKFIDVYMQRTEDKTKVVELLQECDSEIQRAETNLENIQNMLQMELKIAKQNMKKANLAGRTKDFDYYYGQVSGIGTAICCIDKALNMRDRLASSQEIVFFNEGRCGIDLPDRASLLLATVEEVSWGIYKQLLGQEPPVNTYTAFYDKALELGFYTKSHLERIQQKENKTQEDRITLKFAISCEAIAIHGERYYGEAIKRRIQYTCKQSV